MKSYEFEQEWQEYMDLIADLDHDFCPRCKINADILFECGRRVEYYELKRSKETE